VESEDSIVLEDFTKLLELDKLYWVSGDKLDHLKYALESARIPGLVAEFGVSAGYTLPTIANTVSPSVVYGFDWWNGLPTDWADRNGNVRCGKGSFAVDRNALRFPANVVLIDGLVEHTTPAFLVQHKEEVFRLIHMDLDLYAPTKSVLSLVSNGHLAIGSVLVFDELIGNTWNQDNALRALLEVMQENPGLSFVPISASLGNTDTTTTPREQIGLIVTGVPSGSL
jgi:hypothetical protein